MSIIDASNIIILLVYASSALLPIQSTNIGTE
jgi:hypothetical protein